MVTAAEGTAAPDETTPFRQHWVVAPCDIVDAANDLSFPRRFSARVVEEHVDATSTAPGGDPEAIVEVLVTVDDPVGRAIGAWVMGRVGPSGERGGRAQFGPALRSIDHLLTGHVLAHSAIAGGATGSGAKPKLGVHLPVTEIYELGALQWDCLLGRHSGVGRADLPAWIHRRKQEFTAARPTTPSAAFRRWIAQTTVPLTQSLPRLIAAVYAAPTSLSVDVVIARGPSAADAAGTRPVLGRALRTPPPPAGFGPPTEVLVLPGDRLPDPGART